MMVHVEYSPPTPTFTTVANVSSSGQNLKVEKAMVELQVMLFQETGRYSNPCDYLAVSSNHDECTPNDERVSDGWRRKICEWSFEVVDHFGFDREVVSIALSYLDRVVAIKTEKSGTAMHRREFQLVAVTCLYLAIKLHGETDVVDGPRRKLKINAFVELSRGLFTVETLEAKEREILEMLEWKVNPPTTVRIVATLLHLLPEWTVYDQPAHPNTAKAIYEISRYLTELAVCVSSFSFNYRASEIAYASILCAMEVLQNKIHIPYDVRVEFLSKITDATKLAPHDVNAVRLLLIELRPSMFACPQGNAAGLSRSESVENNLRTESDGKISPVCVMNQCRDDAGSPRKRGRHQPL